MRLMRPAGIKTPSQSSAGIMAALRLAGQSSKNKTFFFYNIDVYRERVGRTSYPQRRFA